jgi:hypothetical protein
MGVNVAAGPGGREAEKGSRWQSAPNPESKGPVPPSNREVS